VSFTRKLVVGWFCFLVFVFIFIIFGFVKVGVKGFVVLCCVVFVFNSAPLELGRWIRGSNVVVFSLF